MPGKALSRYRAWLVVNVVFAVFLVLIVPPQLFAAGWHNPAAVLPAVGALIAWWLTFIAAWCAWTRLPKGTR